jgi:DNA-binding GntR family transcriptional regulator
VNLRELAETTGNKWTSTSAFVSDVLREAIIRGIFKSAEQLRQDVIARSLGVSAIPVREAFKTLESEGLLQRIPYRGVFVSQISKEDVLEIYELRLLLEVQAMRDALPLVDDEAISRAEELIAQAEVCSDPHEKSDLNWRFHMFIYGLPRKERLLRFINELHRSVQHYIRLYTTLAGENKLSEHDHRQILSALKDKDETKLVTLLGEHIGRARDLLVFHLEKQKEGTKEEIASGKKGGS